MFDVAHCLTNLYLDISDAAEGEIARQKITEASLELSRLSAFAKIFGNPDCYKALKGFFSQEAESTLQEPTTLEDWAEKAQERANTLVGKLISAAKREFGLES